MRFAHLADLHIGKRVNEFSMLPDQRHILGQIVEHVLAREVDAVVIAGDVYDKGIPPTEALDVLEEFMLALSSEGVAVLAIAGNHDSAERLAFGSRFMARGGVHIARAYSASPQVVTLEDEAGPVDFHLLPYVKPVYVRATHPEEEVATYEDAVRVALGHSPVREGVRSVLVAHQFVTNAGIAPRIIGDAPVAVGGVDNVDASLFDAYDYVALGHIHVPQSVRRPEVRYCGTPLKYSFSEEDHQKTLSVVDFDAAGGVRVEEVPLVPLHEMRSVEGSFEELREQAAAEGAAREDYVRVTLTDDALMDALAKVREFYPNVMSLEFKRVRSDDAPGRARLEAVERKTLPELFEDFCKAQTGEDLGEAQRTLVCELAHKVGEVQA